MFRKTPPSPVHGRPVAKYFAFRTKYVVAFSHNTARNVRERGGVFQTDDVEQGGCPESQFCYDVFDG